MPDSAFSNAALAGKTAIVTGAQQGIGFAISRSFAAAGANVVLNWLDNGDAAMSLAEEFSNGDQPTIATVHGDVTSISNLESLMAAADDFGGANVLVNNAAVFPRVPFLEMSDEDWDGLMDINLRASFRLSRLFARACVDESRAGSIINLTSGAAFRSSPRGVHYVTSKAGIVGMTRALSLELAEYDIRANAIAPGLTDTAQPRFGMTEDEINQAGEDNPLGRIAEPEDIADLAVFLASESSRHITGQTLHVNGGQYLT